MSAAIGGGHAPPVPHQSRRSWWGLWQNRETGESLALFRIACGLCVLYAVGIVALQGMAPVLWLEPADGGYRPITPPWLFRLLGGLTPATLWSVIATALVAGLLLVVGIAGRLAAFLALQSYMALCDLNDQSGGSDDFLLANALWLLVLARSTATLSLSCRVRTGDWRSNALIPAWPRYLAVYQLVLLYWSAGVHKLSAHWLPGGDFSALYYILQQPSWQRTDMSWLAWVYPLTQFATAVTWFWEVSAPLLLLALWFEATADRPGRLRAFFNRLHFRRLFIVIGVTMHLLLFATMELGPFCWVSLSFYLCLIPPSQKTQGPARTGLAPYLLAGFIYLHILAITLLALPSLGGGLNREAWQDPTVRAEIDVWADRFDRWGLDVTPQSLEDSLWQAAVRYEAVRNRLLAPFRLYYQYCGTNQAWGLFAAPHRFPTRLHIDIEKDRSWQSLYIERDPEHNWLGARLDFYRMRGLLFRHGWPGYEEDYNYFTHWLATQAAHDFPDASRLRIRHYRCRSATPEEVREGIRPEGEFINPVILPFGS